MQLLMESAKAAAAAADSGSTATANESQPSSSSSNMHRFYPPKPKISAFNELFMCHLCQGYMINPTTIDVCMHTYCRSCIARHLAVDCYCPQCKAHGGKAITISNLKSDAILRSIIFKLVPGLYQKERERIVQFINNTKNEIQLTGTSSSSSSSSSGSSCHEAKNDYLDSDDDIFSPTDPISLSLEYHPVLVKQCPEDSVPPVRYLQCPASVKVQHLKHFLCSKFEIDPNNKKVGIEIIYEDEVLPSDFTLMDVGYCYDWKRHAPLKFFYRILIYNEEQSPKLDTPNVSEEKVSQKSSETYLGNVAQSVEPKIINNNTSITINGDAKIKSSSLQFLPPPPPLPLSTKVKSNKSSNSSKHHSTTQVTIAPKPVEAKKSVSKKSSLTEDFILPTTNDFKSLRSNDIRYSQYAVTSSTANSCTTTSTHSQHQKTKVKAVTVKEEKPSKCDIVVSIPHNQMQEEWDSKPLSQLKTASKKSPNPQSTLTNDSNSLGQTKKVKNVPKLKIELNSLRTKLIEKPKSADIRLDSLIIKHHRPRKFSLDEKPTPDKVDLETYAKNIGLKPIEVQTPSTVVESELSEKFTPNASPRSSCSSSTTSSSNGHLNVVGDISTSSSSSSHKKRKKKHSKEPRDSKRKKMHAEISSRGADESLKMKVKLTAPLNIKPSKFESKKSPSAEKLQDPLTSQISKSLPATPVSTTLEKPILMVIQAKEVVKEKSPPVKEKSKSSIEKKFKDSLKLKPLAIKTCAKDFEDDEDIVIPDTTSALTLIKPLSNLKDDKLPHSPPLPPSLFKTTPITFSTFAPNNNTTLKPKPAIQPKHTKDKFVTPTKMKPLAPKPLAAKPTPAPMKPAQFAVPNLPRLMATNSTKFHSSTPTSIASSVNKQMGNLLKRSASLDDNKAKTTATGSLVKQPKLQRPHQITVSAYGSNLQVTKVDVPATPTSSTAKATFEIPLYSPLSASYNPKCSFTVSSATASSKSAKPNLSLSIKSNSGSMSANKSQVFSNSVAVNKADTNVSNKSSSSSKIPAHSSKTTTTSLMGPPLPLAKLNTVVSTAVKSPPLGNVLPLNCSKTYSLTSCPSNTAANAMPILAQAKSSTHQTDQRADKSKVTATNTNGLTAEAKPKSSLRQFRLPSRESGQDILDLSSAVPKTTTTNGLQAIEKKSLSIPASPTPTAGTSLELALTKIKQNMAISVNQDNMVAGIELKPNSDDLQNLQMLSESATAREKIAINSTTMATSSLYEKPKINQNTLVRQQNASVRSIPNPSALAFRNHQPTNNIPMVTIAAPLLSGLSNDLDRPMLNAKPSLSPNSPISPNCSTSTSPPRIGTSSLLSSKKHPSIDQVAASLNMRASAAAAAEASAKANLKQLDESSLVTSTSCITETGAGSKLKQIKQETPEQTSTNHEFAQSSSSTVASSSSAEVLEIKQEPEERFHDSLQQAEEQRIVVRPPITLPVAKTTTMTTSKVENLVTSVINVSTPTSTLLTTSSSGGF